MRVLFCSLYEYAGPSDLTAGVLHFIFFLGYMFEVSSEFAGLPFVTRDIHCVLDFRILLCKLKTFSSSLILLHGGF
jgi:hypothetical protein